MYNFSYIIKEGVKSAYYIYLPASQPGRSSQQRLLRKSEGSEQTIDTFGLQKKKVVKYAAGNFTKIAHCTFTSSSISINSSILY